MIENLAETKEIEAVLQHLDALSCKHPDLAAGCSYYRRLLPVLVLARAEVAPLGIEPGKAQQKLDRGEPVLWGEELAFSSPHLTSLFLRVAEAITAEGKTENSNGFAWGSINEEGLAALLDGTLQGDAGLLEKFASESGLEEAVLQVIAQNCLKPFLHVWQSERMPELDVSTWQRGSCPFCGSLPLLAELRGPQRGRHLRCGLCGADWPYNRLQCAYCGTQDSRVLGILLPEGETGRVSIQVCRECHAYLKMVVTLEPIPAGLLPVEDLATLPLDVIAGNYGCRRPG